MSKKKKTKVAAAPAIIALHGAVDKMHAGKSLSELSGSPVSALEGLTPRHARLLEEAFGVKTIEDLSKLKYFEIARAIVTLAKYEQ